MKSSFAEKLGTLANNLAQIPLQGPRSAPFLSLRCHLLLTFGSQSATRFSAAIPYPGEKSDGVVAQNLLPNVLSLGCGGGDEYLRQRGA